MSLPNEGGQRKGHRKLDKSTLLWVLLGVIIVGIAGINLWAMFDKRTAVMPKTGAAEKHLLPSQLPDFALTNQQGQPFGLAELEGKIWVADFIFTHCLTICPPMTLEMARLQSDFVEEPVYFVSFSVNPERDTPEVLSRYAKRYGADERRWHFLTGEKERIYQLAKEGFSLAAGHKGSDILHSTRFALVTPDGKIYGHYDSRSKPALLRLRRDINTLLAHN